MDCFTLLCNVCSVVSLCGFSYWFHSVRSGRSIMNNAIAVIAAELKHLKF